MLKSSKEPYTPLYTPGQLIKHFYYYEGRRLKDETVSIVNETANYVTILDNKGEYYLVNKDNIENR